MEKVDVDNLSFEEAMEELDVTIAELEKAEKANIYTADSQKFFERANLLKEHCDRLLREEKIEIIKTAKSCNISLQDIGLTEDDIDDEIKEMKE
ncbi:MAG: hypothetical protein LBH46_02510 [Rickettsiales bacterium]|jgi:exonuclease VII small subunit|nr:hypothetical protein [Rickettsiales bacterium]